MQTSTNVAILGGGIIGCATAYFLRKRGIEVAVLDTGEIGAEASSAAAGLLAPLGSLSGPGPFADLLLASFHMFPSLVPELEQATGIDLDYQVNGALRVVRNAKNMPRLRKRMKGWQPLGLEMHWLSGQEARSQEPLLAQDICAAIYAPQEAQISAPALVRAFARAAASQGAMLYSHSEVIGIQHSNNKATTLTTANGETLTCQHLVIAAGAWSARLRDWLGIQLPITPQRGQILALSQPSPPMHTIVFGEAAYCAPKGDHTIVVGATTEEVGFEKTLTAGGISWLLSTAIRLLPALEALPIERMWVGLRPKTSDNLPILGPAPGWQNVTIAAGHGSVGVLLSPITGQSIADLIATGTTPELIQPFALNRTSNLAEEDDEC